MLPFKWQVDLLLHLGYSKVLDHFISCCHQPSPTLSFYLKHQWPLLASSAHWYLMSFGWCVHRWTLCGRTPL
ncbi:predicted protein [Lichtheimia corymbifera JMRC:FSU:9682]|uniref:Uncharacterized protein n=1 Tax=Lichtheimia corymbifera JMRC:FSU:9682 TaxID=1263082 RepID=A0A068RI41_9FUNG|nr:predicted protein [Lichtheimia corymbifera JMRC:FSU:9682]